MSTATLAVSSPAVNHISRLRRILRKHNLRLVKCRQKHFQFEARGYQIQGTAVVAGQWFDLDLPGIEAICKILDCTKVVQNF